jgi:hypothetical protein
LANACVYASAKVGRCTRGSTTKPSRTASWALVHVTCGPQFETELHATHSVPLEYVPAAQATQLRWSGAGT